MLFEFGVLFLSLLNLAAIWLVYDYPNQFFWTMGIFAAVLLFGMKGISGKFRFFVLPFFLTLGTVLLLPLIDSPAEAKAFIVLSVGVFYLAVLGSHRLGRYGQDKTAKAMMNLATITALFCWFTALLGWYLNLALSVWIIMLAFALVVFLVSFQSFFDNQLAINRHQRIIYSIFLAYLMAGTIWMQDFWPFGYLTTGVIALIIYYSAWDLIRGYFQEKLTIKKIIFNSIFLAGSVLLILLSAKWYPAV
ncbi:MAG: hypothetical protein QMD77_02900 [Patescibacteria group bacterium]|nr:hypothetical protein [Patescibacteria group bacterium]